MMQRTVRFSAIAAINCGSRCGFSASVKHETRAITTYVTRFPTASFAMPRYYFWLSDGKQVVNNHKGIDLSGNAAAREDALVLARDLKHGAVMPGWDWSRSSTPTVTRSTKCR